MLVGYFVQVWGKGNIDSLVPDWHMRFGKEEFLPHSWGVLISLWGRIWTTPRGRVLATFNE